MSRRGCRRTGRSARKGLAGKMVVGLSCWTSSTVTFALGVDRSRQSRQEQTRAAKNSQEHLIPRQDQGKAVSTPAPIHCHQEPATHHARPHRTA